MMNFKCKECNENMLTDDQLAKHKRGVFVQKEGCVINLKL